MRILQLNVIEFGSVKSRQFDLDRGLNIITGENESGKSTLVLFIKFMLYGLGRKNARGAERERALSFDGHRAAGTMKIECGGEEYLIERSAVLAGRLSESLKITECSSGQVLDGEAGEALLGVPAEVFESSAYISQTHVANIKNAQASTAIENMLVSADESIDVSGVLARIDRVRREYKLNRGDGGLLYDTDMQISSLRARQTEAAQKHERAAQMSAKLLRMQKSAEQAEMSHAASKKRLEDITGAKIVQRYDELCEKRRQLEEERARLGALEEGISKDSFVPDAAHISALEAARSASDIASEKNRLFSERVRSLPKLPERTVALAEVGRRVNEAGGAQSLIGSINSADKQARSWLAAAIVGFALGGIGAISAALLLVISKLAVAACSGGAALICAALGILFARRFARSKKRRDELCAPYGVQSSQIAKYIRDALAALSEVMSSDVEAQTARALLASSEEDKRVADARLYRLLVKTCDLPIENLSQSYESELVRIREFCRKREQSEREIYALEALVKNGERELAEYDIEGLRASLTIDINSITPEMTERAKMAERFDRERKEKLNNELKNVSESLAALRGGLSENPIELEEKIAVLEQKRQADGEYYDALMLAKEHIESASAAMSKNVTPELAKRAGEMLRAVSRDAHKQLQMTKGLDVSLEQDGFFVGADLLSGGTRDAAYLCLRIALMMRVFKGELPPLIIDEALCQLDDARTERMLSLLSGLSNSIQIALFTCHSRESSICEKNGIAATIIELEK